MESQTMNNSDTVKDGMVVTMHYTLTLDDGTEVDTSRGRVALDYLHGATNIVPGLEKEITGHGVGDVFDVAVKAEDGYGPRIVDAVQEVPKSSLPEGVKIQPGMSMTAQAPGGQELVLHVVEVKDEVVVMDLNHPLAGKDLNFAIEILQTRPATQAELDEGSPLD